MPSINRVPQGLLGLLDLKAQGENPKTLIDAVQGTVELGEMYAIQSRVTISQASSITALGVTAGIFLNLVVPQGEMWLVSGMTAHLSAPPMAGGTLAVAVGVVPADVGRFIGLGVPSKDIAAGADLLSIQNGSYLLQPGDAPNVYATTFTGAGPYGIRLQFHRARFVI